MTQTLKLSWTRFAFCFAVIGIVPALLITSNINSRDSWAATAAVCLLFLSLVVFFSLGWARLRKANAAQPILATETDRIRRLLVGPFVPAAVWFASTILAIIALAVASALLGRAA
ncbi:glucan phosphoethanolaminetransferase (alkaline phosphatase superfamily) [Lysobacter niastensis]|uniref:Glucan phosphoethanolaminetransferase (Alkaline phosphatase superfamily) n=1 Tax=Lysobacter niastensis TaxID=380629 RepID=A0ABU1W949_9GAMM|nr:hypothetical protein [Lysobacter niastensis]MDR7134093.1 glucan phosphoethanolaminetransferase (alkaline phosphatase superfamily) [Lysobacter niastensis]